MKKRYVRYGNKMVDYDEAVAYMDNEIREELHAEMAPCTNQEFFDEYIKRHEAKYEEDFADTYCYVMDGEYVNGIWEDVEYFFSAQPM